MLKEQFTHHLRYELWMLHQTMSRIANITLPASDPVGVNALLESFCIHARALVEFFFDPDKDKASRYTLNYLPFHGVEAKTRQFNSRLNKQIAHLDANGRFVTTAGKIDSKEMHAIYEDLRAELQRFKTALRPECRADAPASLPAIAGPTAQSATNSITFVTGSTGTTTTAPPTVYSTCNRP